MTNLDHKGLKQGPEKIVYVIQEIPGTKEGRPKINIMGAQKFGKIFRQEGLCFIYGDGYREN